MKLLLDSHVVVRWLDGAGRLSGTTREAIAARANDVLVSTVTVWELSIEQGVGTIAFDVDLAEHLEEQGFQELPITWRHGAAVRDLPPHHRDPFDRMLVAQTLVEGLTLVTDDRRLSAYGIPVLTAS